MPRFFLGLLILVASLVLQFFASSLGYSFDLAFAALLALAFVLDWRELLPLAAFAALVLNWQPQWSAAIVVYALFPLATCALYRLLPWQPFAAIPIVCIAGVGLLALVSGAGFAAIGIVTILADAVMTAVYGMLVFFGSTRSRA